MNNLPNNTSETDPDAPWNEETEEVCISAIVSLYTTVLKGQEHSILEEETRDQLTAALRCTDFQIEEVIIEEV